MPRTPPSERHLDRGQRTADEALRRLAYELRVARLSAGLSQGTLARRARISPAQLSRLERAAVRSASVRVYTVLFALLGMAVSLRTFPHGSPLRDAAHVRLVRRFVARPPPMIGFRAEVPVGRTGDLRAWDGELRSSHWSCKLEAETVLADVQALERRIALKMADDDVSVVILLVADTRRNREALRDAGAVLTSRFPLDTRAIMAALGAGRCPAASGICII